MDVVRQLIRHTVRGFYDVKAVIIMDALLTHHVLSDKDLIGLLGLPAKDVRSVCARLKEDHLVRESSHKDDVTRDHRVYTQTSYYIHFTEAVDAIKWKIYSIENQLKNEMDAQHNPQDYVCDTCKTRYDTIAAASLFNPELGTFVCEVCGGGLREDDGPAPDESSAQDKMGELMIQLQPLITALREIDGFTIPENTLQSELQQAIPLPAADSVPESRETTPLPTSQPSKLPVPAQPAFKVQITSEAERRQQREKEQREKERLASENQLPQWHLQSTVGETSAQSQVTKIEATSPTAKRESAQVVTKDEDDVMEAYYKKLEAQQSELAEDDEDEDEFEDVEV